jgi:Flagellar biosynthesis protein, FliO
MEMIQPYLSMIYAAAGLLLLVVLAVVAIKMLSGGVRGRKGSRLGISEFYEIDKTRRLVLVRRDNMEHLMMIGGGQDVVIESDIGNPLESENQPVPLRPAPRPAVFGSRRPVLRPVREEPEM